MAEIQKQQSVADTRVATPQIVAEDDGNTIDLMELMYRLLKYWWLILSVAVICSAVYGTYKAKHTVPLYKATATIYVLDKDSVINLSDLQLGSNLTADYIKTFKMWEMHEEVIRNLDLPYSYNTMRNMLTVSNDSNTRMLDLTVTSADPEEAANIANEYAKVGSQFIADTMSTTKPNIMSVALKPSNPININKTRDYLLGFALGLVAMCGVIFVQMILDDKYKTSDDIKKYTGLTTLAIIPVEDSQKNANKKTDSESSRRKS